jgi:hypothetical protein
MIRSILILITLLAVQHGIGQTLIYECGQNSGQNFNGWFIPTSSTYDEIEFDETSTAFFIENGGNYPVSLTKKITELEGYKRIYLLFNFEEIDHCEIENVVYYTSEDGKNWNPINESRNNTMVAIANDSLNISYVKATANVNFAKNGKVACNYVKVEGEPAEEEKLEILTLEEETEDNFFIFSHAHTLNIETALDAPYEVLITSISGQIVYRDQFEGSNRIELPYELNGIFIVSVIQDNTFKASKKVAIQ